MWTDSSLHIARLLASTAPNILGPGCRTVIWVQGCSVKPSCPGCTSPEWIPFVDQSASNLSEIMQTPKDLAEWAFEQDTSGITVSGGEPFAQAAGLADFLETLKDLGSTQDVLLYSGFLYENLLKGTEDQQRLLGLADLLIDGPYVQALRGGHLWRGSSNQRILAIGSKWTPEQITAWMAKSEVKLQYDLAVFPDRVSLTRTGVPHSEVL